MQIQIMEQTFLAKVYSHKADDIAELQKSILILKQANMGYV